MNLNKLLFLTLFVTSLISEDDFSTNFNYFGNLSASKLNSAGYDLNYYNNDSVGDTLSLSSYSSLGAQISLNYNDITFTAQGLLSKNHGSYDPEFTWLNIKYDMTDNFAVRAGRIQTKVLLNSESLDIDYLHLWAKAPVEVYRLMPVRTYNGLELTYNGTIEDYSFSISGVLFAFYETDINNKKDSEVSLKVDNSRSISFTLENEKTTFKASYSRSDSNIEDDASTIFVVEGLKSYGNDMDRFTYEDRTGYVSSLGFQYRGDSLLVNTEIAHFKSNSLLASSTGAYLMLGYKMDKLTPYIIYAENKNDKDHYDTSDVKTSDEKSIVLKRALDDILYLNNFSQQTSSIGMRYDIKTGMALKLQVDRITSTNYGSISSQSVQISGYEKVGILSREAGIDDKTVYAGTVSLSFAY